MKNMIRSMVTEYNDAWDECLPWILFAYQGIPVETLGFSPFELLFGRVLQSEFDTCRLGDKGVVCMARCMCTWSIESVFVLCSSAS